MLDNAALKDLMTKNSAARRQARGCRPSRIRPRDERPLPGGAAWIKADRKTVRYRSRQTARRRCAAACGELAAEQRRFGWSCRLHILLRAEGHVLNRKEDAAALPRVGEWPGPCASARVASGRRLYGGRSWSRRGRTPAGRSDSSTTSFFERAALPHPQRDRRRHQGIAWSRDRRHLNLRMEWVARELDTIIARRGKPDLIISDHRTRVHLQRHARLAQSSRITSVLHCPGKTDAKRHLRGVQRPHARRTAQRDDLLRSRLRPIGASAMDRCIQSEAPHQPRLSHPPRPSREPSPQRATAAPRPAPPIAPLLRRRSLRQSQTPRPLAPTG